MFFCPMAGSVTSPAKRAITFSLISHFPFTVTDGKQYRTLRTLFGNVRHHTAQGGDFLSLTNVVIRNHVDDAGNMRGGSLIQQ